MNEEELKPRLCQCKNRTPGSIITVESVETMICADCGYRVENTHNEEELKPCPFCGQEQNVEHWDGDGDIVDPPCIGDYFTLEEWNSAYCWKEIDRLKAALQAKDEEISQHKSNIKELCRDQLVQLHEKDAEIDTLEKQVIGLTNGKLLQECIAHRGFIVELEVERDRLNTELQAERSRSEKLVELGQTVMDALEQNGESIVKHFLDTDDNPGQRFRDLLAAHRKPEEAGK